MTIPPRVERVPPPHFDVIGAEQKQPRFRFDDAILRQRQWYDAMRLLAHPVVDVINGLVDVTGEVDVVHFGEFELSADVLVVVRHFDSSWREHAYGHLEEAALLNARQQRVEVHRCERRHQICIVCNLLQVQRPPDLVARLALRTEQQQTQSHRHAERARHYVLPALVLEHFLVEVDCELVDGSVQMNQSRARCC